MGPGPSNPYPEVSAALGRPLLGHLDPEFLALLDETCERLRRVFRTANTLTFPVSATGSGGMETAFVNFVRPGDVVVVGVNGLFGERMCDVARRLGASVVAVEAPWGEPLDPAAVLAAHDSPTMIAVVHAETSTGVRNEVEPIGRAKGDALLLVDMVTSLGGIEVDVDAWHVDIAYSGTQKCLGVPPGLSPLTVADRARQRLVESPSSWYFDLNLLSRYVDVRGRSDVPPHRPGGHGLRAPRRARSPARRGPRSVVGPARGRAVDSSRRVSLSMGLRLVAPAAHRLAAADHRLGPRRPSRRRRRGGRAAVAAGRLRYRDRGRGGPHGREGLAYRVHGAHGAASQRDAATGRPR